jgi:tetratricopeptide (TPR) repeat protein
MFKDTRTSPMGEVDWGRYNRAIELRDSGIVSQALAEIHELAETSSNPDEKAILLANEVVCLRLMGQFEKAWEPLKQAYSLLSESSPTFPFIGFHEARLLFDQHRGEEALKKVEWLLSHCASTLQLPESRADLENIRILQATLLVQLNRSAEARPILEEAVSYDSQRERAAYYLGRCYLDLGMFEEAKQRFQEALNLGLEGDLALKAHYMLGTVYFKLGSYAWAKQEFETCLSFGEDHDPSRRNIYGWLAATCQALGEREGAANYEKLANRK